MQRLMSWLLQVLIAIDQLGNALLFAGWADETISARAWRQRAKWQWRIARLLIDGLFRLFGSADHSRQSFDSEATGQHLPQELRRKSTPA